MKKSIILAVSLLITVCSFAQSGKSIYTKYSDGEDVSAVYISSAMFKMIGKLPSMELSDSEVNLGQTLKSLNGFYLLNVENQQIISSLKTDVEKFIEKGNYEMLMEAKDNGDIVKFYSIGDDKIITGLVMFASEPNESTFICIDGEIIRDEFLKLMKNID